MRKFNNRTWKRYVKHLAREIYKVPDLTSDDPDATKRVDMYGNPAPPYKVGKQFPYSNARRAGRTHPGRIERAEFDMSTGWTNVILKEG